MGRLMLGYGRAVTATIALAKCALRSELKAAKLVTSDSKILPKRMRKLFRGNLEPADFKALSHAMDRMKFIAEQRHQLVHGEWWFNVFKGGHLQTRNVQTKGIKHTKAFSVDLLDQYAGELDKIADELDRIEYGYERKIKENGARR